jgi:hypothetical protein
MIADILDPKHGQLSVLYLKWKDSPEEYGAEMAETVDKIIFSTLHRQPLQPIYWKIEDKDDLLQELRAMCFQKLNRITNPDNKRIFNYLRVSIKLALKDKSRKVGKRLDREEKEAEVLGEKTKSFPTLFYFNDIRLEQIATLIASGETKQNICSQLNISRTVLKREIERLRIIYYEKK